MAISYQTPSKVAYGSRTNTTFNVPAGIANGDFMILTVVTANNGTAVTPALPAGWTALGTPKTGTDGSFGWRRQKAWREASSEPASYTVTHTTTGCEVLCERYSGSGTLSIDTSTENNTAIASQPVTGLSVTPSVINTLLSWVSLNWDITALSPPTGMTERQDSSFIYYATQPLSTTSATGNYTQTSGSGGGNPWFADMVVIKEAAGGGGSQGITGALHTNSQSFYGATVSPGPASIAGSLFTNSNSIYGATVGRGAVNIGGALYTNSSSFYGGTVSASYTIQGALFTDGDTFYGATINPGSVTISGALFSNSSTFYAANVNQGAGPQTINGSLFSNGQTFYAASVQRGAVTINGGLFSNSSSFYSSIVTAQGGPQSIVAARYDNTNQFFSGSVSPGAVTISGTLYSDPDGFYAATVRGSYNINGALFSNGNQFFGASVSTGPGGTQSIVGSLYANDNHFYSAVVFVGSLVPTAQSRIAVRARGSRTAIATRHSRIA